MTLDEATTLLEKEIGAKIIGGDMSNPGSATFHLYVIERNWSNVIRNLENLSQKPGDMVWTFEGHTPFIYLSVRPRQWIGVPPSGPFVTHLAIKEI